MKWITLGDAGTKFFHANASIKFRRNLITTLKNLGVIVTEHNTKVDLIWDSFKDRLGVSFFQGMNFDLSALRQPDLDLSFLVNPFF